LSSTENKFKTAAKATKRAVDTIKKMQQEDSLLVTTSLPMIKTEDEWNTYKKLLLQGKPIPPEKLISVFGVDPYCPCALRFFLEEVLDENDRPLWIYRRDNGAFETVYYCMQDIRDDFDISEIEIVECPNDTQFRDWVWECVDDFNPADCTCSSRA
jgi:hypothetical protein